MQNSVLVSMAEKYGTPFYLFDFDGLRNKVAQIRRTLPENVSLCYAIKANPFFLDPLRDDVEKYEICSPGEFRICKREKVDMKKVVLSGVYKDHAGVADAVKQGVLTFTVESMTQFELLKEVAEEYLYPMNLLLRVTSGNQFGLDESEVFTIISNRETYEWFQIQGLQYYSGTQKKKISQHKKELDMLFDLRERLAKETGFLAEEIEYGPGLFVSYFESDPHEDMALLEEFSKLLETYPKDCHLSFEMGRFMAANCGYYVSSIVDMKRNKDQNYCIIDGGIHHVNYYGQTMAMKKPVMSILTPKAEDAVEEQWNICGALCTVSDVLVKNYPIKEAAIGDLLCFKNIGAYSVTEGIYMFLSRKMPRILSYRRGIGEAVIRQEIPTDIMNSDWSKITDDEIRLSF